MPARGRVIKGKYYDSVTLMTLAKRVREAPGVIDCVAVMGTAENRSILESSGFPVSDFKGSSDTDLVVAIQANDENTALRELAAVDEIMAGLSRGDDTSRDSGPWSLEGALAKIPDANIALISVAGKYAFEQAMRALRAGLHVMLFSDNVTLENEIELKKIARDRGLLVMGPDCGTAIIGGAPLAFANVVERGDIGIVAASGTGLQEVTCMISNNGAGVSQVIGTGGRDIKDEVGGITFLQGLGLLSSDTETKIIVLVSKPPGLEVLQKTAAVLRNVTKPVVTVFLGADGDLVKGSNIHPASTLEEGALLATALSLRKEPRAVRAEIAERDSKLREQASSIAANIRPPQRYIRGLFSGGTFCSEAQIILKGMGIEMSSNIPAPGVRKISDASHADGHALVDFGADEFTVGRPHPMIDFSMRNKGLIESAADTGAAVILFDIVLGYGAHENPPAEIIPAIEKAKEIASSGGRHLALVSSVTGTDKDPQNRSHAVAALERAGVHVAESNAAACRLAGFIAGELRKRK